MMNHYQVALRSIADTQAAITRLYDALVSAEIMHQMHFNGFTHLTRGDMESTRVISEAMREDQQKVDSIKRLLSNKKTILSIKIRRLYRSL